MKLLARLIATVLVLAPASAAAATVDPFAVVEEAFKTYQKKPINYPEVRAIFSRALRQAASEGPLSPDFAIVYSMYADTARSENNPAFALQLAEQGLSLALLAEPPDDELKNLLLISRAYSLADLGRYQEAVEGAQITAFWVDPAQRNQLESDVAHWAEQAAAADKQYSIPSVGKIAADMIAKARDALTREDTRSAIELASRALVPEQSGLSMTDVRLINAYSYKISGVAHLAEGRTETAALLFRRAIDLITRVPWDGRTKPALDSEILSQPNGPALALDLFLDLAASIDGAKDAALASAALGAAADLATTPDRRLSLLLQQAFLTFSANDYAAAEQRFMRAVTTAREAGDEPDAKLAEFYVATARLARAEKSPKAPELAELARKADAAVEAFGSDLQTADYVLSTATRSAYNFRLEHADAAPLAAHAFDVFVARQSRLAGNEAGQDSARRQRRNFLEIVIGASYDSEKNASSGGAK